MTATADPGRPGQADVFAPGSRLVTLVFTDIVGSTAAKHALGDRGGTALIQEHHQLVRETLAHLAPGEEIVTAGDSFLLLFHRPSDAVQFALRLHARLRQFNAGKPVPLEDRIGIHLGEVVMEEGGAGSKPRDVHGVQVDTCARVMSMAQGGRILVTRAVFDNARQMLKGEDIEGVGALSWVSHGRYLLKGVEEPVEICEVAEADRGPLRPPETTEKARRRVTPDEELVLGWRPAVGTAVPNTQWVLEKKLGEGGFGEVWLGRHQVMKERRVFKFCFRADRVRSLKREMTLFRLIKERIGDHPHIVSLREVYFDAPPFYVEMDYVAGQDLRAWCEQQGGAEKVPLAARLEIVAQIADALQAAHDAGVIHRDVKPANILVSGQGSVISDQKEESPSPLAPRPSPLLAKLTDFGIGQVVSEEALKGVTKAGFTQTLVADSSSSQTGSQMYMAPELLAGKPASIRSDIYSLGVVLYQVLVGAFHRPLTSDWTEDIPDPLLRDDLRHCVAGKPADRFVGAGQLATNLRQLKARTVELARRQAEQAERERLRQQAERRRKLLVAGGCVALVLVALAVALGYGLRQAQVERNRQRSFAYAADMNLAQQALAVSKLGPAQGLLNRHHPQAGEKDLRGWEWRYLWQQCQSDAFFILCQKTNWISSLAASSDGKWLAVGERQKGGLSVWDLGTRQAIANLPAGEGQVRVAFAPRSALLAFSMETGLGTTNYQCRVRLWDGLDKRLLPAELPLDNGCTGLAFSEDGRTLMTSTFGEKGQLTLWRVPEGTKLASTAAPQSPYDNGTPVAAARDLSVAAVSGWGSGIRLLDLPSLQERWRTPPRQGIFPVVAFSPDAKVLASGEGINDAFIRLWDVATGQPIGPALEGHRAWIGQLVFWPDGKTLASASADQTIRLWDLSDPTQVHPLGRPLRGHKYEIWRLVLLPDQRTLVSGSKDGAVCVWDTTKLRLDPAAPVLLTNIAAWRFSPDSQSVLTVDREGRVVQWKGAQFQERERLMEIGPIARHANPTCDALISEDGRWLAAAATNGTVRLWDLPP